MAITPDVLFHGIPGTTENVLTNGPASGKRWVVTAVYCANTTATDATLTIKHRIDATPTDRVIVPGSTITANTSLVFGPLVVEYGQSLRALQGTASAIHVTAYGYEEDV